MILNHQYSGLAAPSNPYLGNIWVIDSIIVNEAVSQSDSSRYRLPVEYSVVFCSMNEVMKIKIAKVNNDMIAKDFVLASPTLNKLSERFPGTQINAKINA